MEKSFKIRKINLFFCKKYNCWLKPESCIKRQKETKEKNEWNNNDNNEEEIIFTFPDCRNCLLGKGMSEIIKTYFRLVEVRK